MAGVYRIDMSRTLAKNEPAYPRTDMTTNFTVTLEGKYNRSIKVVSNNHEGKTATVYVSDMSMLLITRDGKNIMLRLDDGAEMN